MTHYPTRPRWRPTTSVAELRERVIPIVEHVETYGIDQLTMTLRIAVDEIFTPGFPNPHTALRVLRVLLRRGYAFDLDAEEIRCAVEGDDSDAERDSFGREFVGEG